ncbi:MAG: hypothetical protein EXQ56_12135 [Acidobacteria bacterium]|nr:hypothetical protein [Acidobacteriota bacterium]
MNFDDLYIEPFVNVRLTTIPVAGAASEGGKIIAPTAAFLQSQKAEQVQFGILVSYNFGLREVGSKQFHWGLGPTFQWGAQSVTDTQRTTRVWNIQDDLYDSYLGGLRLTLYSADKESTKKDWSPAAYFDFSLGKFQSFETASAVTVKSDADNCLKDPSVCLGKPEPLPPRKDYNLEKRLRGYAEVRLFLKNAYFGFDLNNGRGHDDLRFIGGLTVSLNQFMQRKQ